MSMSSGSDNNNNNGTTANGDYTRINWNPPGRDGVSDSVSTKNATLALKTAIAVARAFDANCALRNPAKECTIPMFEPQELVLGEPLRSSGFFTDVALRGIKLTRNLQHGEFSEDEEEFRLRFAERSIDGHYAVKFLQKGIYNSVHAASAASDMMMETKILMNLAPHPNICQIYGVTAAGSDAFLSRGKEGFYIVLDRLSGTMIQRTNEWRQQQQKDLLASKNMGEDDNTIALGQYQKLMQRLEVALDIGSALLFLSDRQIVFHLRPDKVGFDVRYSRIKLCDFGQARENGQLDQAPSLTKTDDIRTLAYTAPEVLCQAPVTVAADVYSYGIVLWEMLSLQKPFEGMSRSEHFERVIMEGERPPLSPNIPKSVKALIEKCWDPHLRPTMKKVYDTVEEILLFQDDKPDVSVFPVLSQPPLESSTSEGIGRTASQDELQPPPNNNKPKRSLRRTKTSDGAAAPQQQSARRRSVRREQQHASGSGEEGQPMKDKSKGSNHDVPAPRSRKSRTKSSSGHDEQPRTSRNSHHEDMVDDSKESQGMKDGSKKRSSRRPRGSTSGRKSTASEEGNSNASGEDREGDDDKRYSLPTIPSEDQQEEPRKMPGFGRSNTAENMAPREKSSSSGKGPALGRSQTTAAGASRKRR